MELNFIDIENTYFKNKKYILIEPHPDDIVYSMGGSLIKMNNYGYDIQGICVFSDSHIGEIRKKESLHVWNDQLNIPLCFLNFKDAIERNPDITFVEGTHLYKAIYNSIFDKIKDIKDTCQLLIFAPLGVGDHTDHILISDICHRIQSNFRIPVIFYEDFPYVDECRFNLYKRLIKIQHLFSLKPLYIPISDTIQKKIDMYMEYYTQNNASYEYISKKIINYGKSVGYEYNLFNNSQINKEADIDICERFWISN